jgi:hypothetical protein
MNAQNSQRLSLILRRSNDIAAQYWQKMIDRDWL